MRKIAGILLFCVGIFLIFFVWYVNSGSGSQTRLFSSYTLLTSSWEFYKRQFLNTDGRIVDPMQNNVTTSEAQSYALLRAVWTDDKLTFDLVWKWTKNNMKRPTDNLFGWRWGKNGNNSYGFLQNGGNNSASDADEDIALALILAARRWKDISYINQAQPVIHDIWAFETADADGKRYLIAGNWALDKDRIILNPSYFAPYTWRIFAKIDSKDNWNSLINPAYVLLSSVGFARLDTIHGSGLPPNWLAINRGNGHLQPTNLANLTTDYSFDAMRTPWRIALDYLWNKDQRAYSYLKKNYSVLAKDFAMRNMLAQSYTHDGNPTITTEDPTMYATSLGYFMIVDPAKASDIYQNKIIQLYSNDQSTFDPTLPYYQQNWLWFGAALYNKYLSNFK